MGKIAVRRFACLAFILPGLAACGGGSSGSGPPPSTPPPQAPPLPPQVSIDQTNAKDIATGTFFVSENLLMLGDALSVALQKMDGTALDPQPGCLAGELEAEHDDRDQDGRLSSGDSILMHYLDCRLSEVDGTVHGDAAVDLVAMDDFRGTEDVDYIANISTASVTISRSNGTRLEMSAEFEMTYRRGLYDAQLTVRSHPGNTGSGDPDFELVKTEDFETASYSMSLQGILQTNGTNETAEFATVAPFSSAFNTYPQEGVLEILGDGGSKLRVAPDAAVAGRFVLEVDPDGDGQFDPVGSPAPWEDLVRGHFWWYAPGAPHIAITPYDPNDFRILHYRPFQQAISGRERHGVNSPVRLQASRTINADSFAGVHPRLSKFDDSYPYTGYTVDLDVEVRGALVLFHPLSQLDPDGAYLIDPAFIWISDLLGNQAAIAWYDLSVTTNEPLSARASPLEAYGFPGDTVSLTAAESTAADGSALSFDWSQVEGPAAVMEDPAAESTTVVLPQVSAPELVRLYLRAANEFGEYDFAKADITVFPSPAEIDLIVVRGTRDDGTKEEYLLTPGNGTQQYHYSGAHSLSVDHETRDRFELSDGQYREFGEELDIHFSSGFQTVFAVGAYENITLGSVEHRMSIDRSFPCSFGTAEFHVLEFETAADNSVTKLAIDYAMDCYPGPYTEISGHIRKRSLVPIPPSGP